MRRKNYIAALSQKDERFCKIIKNSQHLSKKQALSLLTKNRLENFVKEGVLKRLYLIGNNRKEDIYMLTPKGGEWIKKNFSHFQGSFYSSPTAAMHNVKLAELVIEHTKNGHEWLTERDLREILLRDIENNAENRFELLRKLERREISVPDGAYIREDGSIQCFEVVTSSYNDAVIQAKMAFSEITNLPIEFIRQ